MNDQFSRNLICALAEGRYAMTGAAAGGGRHRRPDRVMARQTHDDAARLARIAQGLPPDVHDPATVAAYQALRSGGKAERTSEHQADHEAAQAFTLTRHLTTL